MAKCEVCGHEWLTAKEPRQCAKCRSRKWNAGWDSGVRGQDVSAGAVVPDAPRRPATHSEATKRVKGKVCECGNPMKDWGRVWKCQMCRAEVRK